jgi:hypothetical protein
MANEFFVVKNGLEVGSLTIDATTGNITTSGTIVTTAQSNTFTDLHVTGNLTVGGTETIVNATTVAVTDLNITVAAGAASAAAANGAGLTAAGAGATFTYTSADDRWNLNKNLNVGTVYGALSGNVTGNVTGDVTGNVTGNVSGTALNITQYTVNQSVGTSSSPTFAGVTTPSITKNGTNGTGDIGQAGNTFGTIYATASSAKYADLAEKYVADKDVAPGTVVCFGGDKEVTECTEDGSTAIAGVVSTKPAYIMNAECSGEFVATVAFTGRVPCKVVGPVRKGDMMVAAGNGAARAEANPKVGSVIGKALENFDGAEGTIEVVVGK